MRLALRVWAVFAMVRLSVARRPLPAVVEELGRLAAAPARAHPPARLSRAVDRVLRLGRRRPTCLLSALVLYRLLRLQGDQAQVVIGLPRDPATHSAHAWVELDGRDVGPPPGRGGRVPLARYD